MQVTIARLTVSPLITRAMPDALALLFAVSQLEVILDVGALARDLRALPWGWRALCLAGIVALASLQARPALQAVLYAPATEFLWGLPATPARLGRWFTPTLGLAALPAVGFALLLGPGPALAASVTGVMAGQAAASGCWGSWAFALGISGLLAGPWGALAPLGAPWAWARVGRDLRAGRPLGGPRVRAIGWASGPVSALIVRDLLAVARTHPRGAPWLAVAQGLGVGFAVNALHRTWSPAEVSAGAVIAVGFVGLAPSLALAIAAKACGRAFHDRALPIGPRGRALALFGVGVASLGPALSAIGFVHPAGLLRAGAHGLALAGIATWSAAHPRGQARLGAPGVGLAAAVFLTVGAVAIGPWSALVELGIGGVALAAATARLTAGRR